jgi:fatty-acid desaturase
VRKGLLYSHIGWLVLKQDPKRLGRSDISDLNTDPVVVFQHKHYESSRVLRNAPILESHSLTVLSRDAEARSWPLVKGPLC